MKVLEATKGARVVKLSFYRTYEELKRSKVKEFLPIIASASILPMRN